MQDDMQGSPVHLIHLTTSCLLTTKTNEVWIRRINPIPQTDQPFSVQSDIVAGSNTNHRAPFLKNISAINAAIDQVETIFAFFNRRMNARYILAFDDQVALLVATYGDRLRSTPQLFDVSVDAYFHALRRAMVTTHMHPFKAQPSNTSGFSALS